MIRLGGLIATILLMFGCAAAQLSIEKSKLDVQTKTSKAIFLAPVGAPSQSLYMEIKSGVMEFDETPFRQYVEESLFNNQSPYALVDNPEEADFHLLVSIFNLEKVDPSAAELALTEGYGGPSVVDVATSVAEIIDYEVDDLDDLFKVLVATVIIGIAETAINSTVKDVTYMLVADVEVAAANTEGVSTHSDTTIENSAGEIGSQTQLIAETVDRTKYRTRIVTTANKANLKLQEARSAMFQQMAYAIAGIFAKADVPLE